MLLTKSAEIIILRYQFDPLAKDAYDLLTREFEFEFTALRWLFLISVLSLFEGITYIILVGNDLLHYNKRTEMVLVISAAISIFAALRVYICKKIQNARAEN